MQEIKKTSNSIINGHLILSLLVSLILYISSGKNFALAFAFGSLTLNLYLRMLQNTLWLGLVAKLNLDMENKPLLIIFSALRTLLVAAAFALMILKLKFNLIALASSFICYNIIVIALSFKTRNDN